VLLACAAAAAVLLYMSSGAFVCLSFGLPLDLRSVKCECQPSSRAVPITSAVKMPKIRPALQL